MTTTSLPHDSAVTPVTLSHLPCFATPPRLRNFLTYSKRRYNPHTREKLFPHEGKFAPCPGKYFFH